MSKARPRRSGRPVLIAGEPERLHQAKALVEGIELDEGSWHDISDAAADLGVAM